jgi:septal ring factor EnvC (AmiA/AmiB activator)
VWVALPHQWALIEEANKQLSKKSAEVDELRVVHATLKEEVAQAWDAAAKAREDATKAQEEAAKPARTLRHCWHM